MPPTTPENETLTQTADRARSFLADRGVTVEPTVRASVLTEPPQPITVPEPQQAPGPSPTLNAGIRSTLLNTRATAQGARELEQRQQELADLGAVSSVDLQQQMQERFGVTPDRLRQLEDFESQLAAMQEESGLIQTRIQGAAGQTLGQAGREVTQEQREFAVRSAGTAAQAEILRGNIETGRQLAQDAVNLSLQDREFNSRNLLQQIDSLQGRVDQETEAALADQKFQVEQELATIAEVKENVASAIASGAASQADIAAMTDPNVSDADKLALAQSIVGRGATQERNLEIAQRQAAIDASRAGAANSWANYQATQMEMQMMQDAAQDRQDAIDAGLLLPEQAEVVDDIDKQFRSEPVVKAYNEAVAKRFAFEEIMDNGVNGVQDLTLVYEYMKSIDPNSVVKESEFDMAAKSGNIFAGQFAKFNKGYLGQGGVLPDDVKNSFLSAANSAFDGRSQQYQNVKEQFGKKVDRRLGIADGQQYLTAYEAAAPLTEVDFGISNSLVGASEQDMADIMMMTNELLASPGGVTQ